MAAAKEEVGEDTRETAPGHLVRGTADLRAAAGEDSPEEEGDELATLLITSSICISPPFTPLTSLTPFKILLLILLLLRLLSLQRLLPLLLRYRYTKYN